MSTDYSCLLHTCLRVTPGHVKRNFELSRLTSKIFMDFGHKRILSNEKVEGRKKEIINIICS